jgi:hypothetical protein
VNAGETPSARSAMVVVVLAKAFVGALVLATGFRAISDDDYSRVVIAESFAAHPSLDPSGSSWLPLPFWIQGSVMLLFGPSLAVARATSFGLGILSACLVYVAARWLGSTAKGALVGALFGAIIPYAAWLGVATVPDGPTAALLLLGFAAAREPTPRRALLGGLGLAAATLSRYEAWPVALGFAAFCLVDAFRPRGHRRAALGAAVLAGPVAWMVHGALHHGDATFFLARVAAYRHAIGAGSGSMLARIAWCPFALFRCEPELTALVLLGLGIAHRAGGLGELGRYRRALVLALGLLVFLVVGDLGGGAATHHRERSLLAVWLLGAVLGGDLLTRRFAALARAARPAAFAALVVAIGLVASVVRPRSARRDGFVDRSDEVAIGERARIEARSGPALLVVDTEDYGYFAVMAAFGRPSESTPADDHDPRRARGADAFSGEAELRRRLGRATWLVATRNHESLARRVGSLVAETPRLTLFRLGQ